MRHSHSRFGCSRRTSALLATASVVTCLYCAAAPATASAARGEADGSQDPAARPAARNRVVNPFTLKAGATFRDTCERDYKQALKRWSFHEARARFEQFDQNLWRATTPQQGWSYFLSASVVALGSDGGTQGLIAFYHPWADVFLVTVWTEATAQPWLADAEVILGEWVRRGEVPPEPIAAWLQSEEFKPVAVAAITARSVQAFERRFGKVDPDRWRAALPGLDDPKVREKLNYPGAAQLLMGGLTRLNDFQRAGGDEHSQLANLRTATDAAVQLALAGRFDELLAEADQTPPETRELLRKLPPEQFGSLTVASTLIGRDASLVFLISPGAADQFVSFYFAGSQAPQKLRRIDLLSYKNFFQAPVVGPPGFEPGTKGL